ncbi:DDE-type integrase/transposase/recombinase [Mycobacterium sp. SMC-8]|uniref:DDE-type integrase/transposase/recombinase n=1 Tax=Mycobacterium sp. SMC-8 TaxID=2857060 RepID=UPI0037C66063
MCAVLSEFGVVIAPSTYYAHRARRGPSKADWTDAQVIDAIWRLRRSNKLFAVLGARKTWIVLRTNGLDVSRCVVERVMREMGWRGACKRRRVRTTIADPAATRAPDRVARHFVAGAPDRLWVADFTYCRTRAGWAYTAFVTDVYARKIVGWKVATEMTQKLVTDAINHAIDTRKRSGATFLDDLIHHSDAGSQGGFNWSSQHLDHGGVVWPSVRTRNRLVGDGSGRLTVRCGLRCAHQGARTRRGRCSVSFGG